MKIFLIAICLTSVLAAAAPAGQSAPAAATAPAAPAAKRESTFDASDARNPFWPIGWKKPDTHNADSALAAPALTASSFALTSVTTSAESRFAILNGKTLQEGQQFRLQLGNQTYQVTVESIQDGEIVLAYPGGQVVVPLRRH